MQSLYILILVYRNHNFGKIYQHINKNNNKHTCNGWAELWGIKIFVFNFWLVTLRSTVVDIYGGCGKV